MYSIYILLIILVVHNDAYPYDIALTTVVPCSCTLQSFIIYSIPNSKS